MEAEPRDRAADWLHRLRCDSRTLPARPLSGRPIFAGLGLSQTSAPDTQNATLHTGRARDLAAPSLFDLRVLSGGRLLFGELGFESCRELLL